MRRLLLAYVAASVAVVLLNSSVNYFDPFNSGFGNFSTAIGTSTTGLWILAVIALDGAYGAFSFLVFKRLSKSR